MSAARVLALLVLAMLALLPAREAVAQTTCFGNSTVMTCLGSAGNTSYQVNCFGSPQFQTCVSQNTQFAQSGTPASASASSNTAAFQSSGGSTSSDPAFGAPPTSPNDPAFGAPPSSPNDPAFASSPALASSGGGYTPPVSGVTINSSVTSLMQGPTALGAGAVPVSGTTPLPSPYPTVPSPSLSVPVLPAASNYVSVLPAPSIGPVVTPPNSP